MRNLSPQRTLVKLLNLLGENSGEKLLEQKNQFYSAPIPIKHPPDGTKVLHLLIYTSIREGDYYDTWELFACHCANMSSVCVCVYVCVCVCVFWTPVSLAWPNYEVAGFQPQAADHHFIGSVYPPRYIFNPLNAKVCTTETNERRTDNRYSFLFHPSIILSPKRYDNNETRRMIRITYRDKGGKIGGTCYAVIRILLPHWIGQGKILTTNEHLDNWPLPVSVITRYYVWA